MADILVTGALDLFAKPVFGALLLWGHKDIDPARLGLHIRDYTSSDATYRGDEKHSGAAHGTNGVTGTAPATTAPTTAAPTTASATTAPATTTAPQTV